MTYKNAWIDDWNDIIRNVIFADQQLRELMQLPQRISIIQFIQKYFIRAGFTNSTLSNQAVRIIYADVNSNSVSQNVTRNQFSFDIYVKMEQLHNVCPDRLVYRTNAIANRIIQLLTSQRYLNGYRFWVVGQTDIGTSTIGYARHNVTFNYMKVY